MFFPPLFYNTKFYIILSSFAAYGIIFRLVIQTVAVVVRALQKAVSAQRKVRTLSGVAVKRDVG
jgi:hypothetical protein